MITSAPCTELQVHSAMYDRPTLNENNKLSLYNETVQLIHKVENIDSCERSQPSSGLQVFPVDVLNKSDSETNAMHDIKINDNNFSCQLDMTNLESVTGAAHWNSNYTASLFDEGFSLDDFVFGQNSTNESWQQQQQRSSSEHDAQFIAQEVPPPFQSNLSSKEYQQNQAFDTRNQNFLDLITVNDAPSVKLKENENNDRRRDYSVSSDSGVGSSIIWDISPPPSEGNVSSTNTSPNAYNVQTQYSTAVLNQRGEVAPNNSRLYSRSSVVEEDEEEDEPSPDASTNSGPVEKMSKKTAYNEKWGVKVLKAWCNENDTATKFENLTPEELNSLLCRFWGEVRKSNGDYYGRNSLFNLRAMINKHLKGHPYNVKYDIVTDDRFRVSNERLEKQLKVLKGIGKTITHKQPISIADLRLMYDSNVLGMHNPLALLRKVWFEITLHFGHKGSESQEKLMNTTFNIYRDPSSRAYVSRIKKSTNENEEVRMYETGGELCPVRSYQKYVSKLHPLQTRLFQQPRRKSTPNSPMWYGKAPIGEKALQQMMANISVAAKLSKRYTNHCVRTTALEQFCDSRRKGKSKIDTSRQFFPPHSNHHIPVNPQLNYQHRRTVYDQSTNNCPLPPMALPSPVRTVSRENYYGKRPSAEMYPPVYQQSNSVYACQNNGQTIAKRARYDQKYNESYSVDESHAQQLYYENVPSAKRSEVSINSNYLLSETVVGGHETSTTTVYQM